MIYLSIFIAYFVFTSLLHRWVNRKKTVSLINHIHVGNKEGLHTSGPGVTVLSSTDVSFIDPVNELRTYRYDINTNTWSFVESEEVSKPHVYTFEDGTTFSLT